MAEGKRDIHARHEPAILTAGFGDSHGQIHLAGSCCPVAVPSLASPAPGPARTGWFSGSLIDAVMGTMYTRLRRLGVSGSRKGLAFEQGRARPHAGTTHLGADRAVAMMLGVPIALLGTRGARPDTRHEQIADGKEVPLAGSRKNPRRGVADVGADQIDRDAGSQRDDVRLDEIGVRARRAGLDARQAGVDRGGELRRRDRDTRRGGMQHLEGLSHAL
jgi:hypothetical protein